MILSKEIRENIGVSLLIAFGLFLIVLGIAILSSKSADSLFLSIISFCKGKPSAPHWLDRLLLIGLELLFFGAVTVAIACLSLLRPSLFLSLSPNHFLILIWSLIATQQFSLHYHLNEVDVLPSAKQFVEHNWLPKDWYLNLDIGYRFGFNLIFGPLVNWLGFQYGAYVGRLLVYLLLAFAIYVLIRVFRLRPWLALLFLLFFLRHQSLVAGEWIVDGLDTKTIAYAFVILSFSTFFRKRYLLGFAFAGAALSFHVLVGSYAIYCTAVAILLNRAWRSDWRLLIFHCWPFFITGVLGFRAIIKQLFAQPAANVTKAWELYVKYRVPHHLLPAAWSGEYTWILLLVLATCLFLAVYFFRRSNAARFIATYALGSLSLFFLGLAIYAWGDIPLLRYYWFRFPDVMVPFLGTALVALFPTDIADGRLAIPNLSQSLQSKSRALLNRKEPILITAVIIILIIAQQMYKLGKEYKDMEYTNSTKATEQALRWIARNTPEEAVFLVDPTILHFYVYAQRAMFVSFKHSPQSAADLLEWYNRLKLCNGNHSPEKTGFDSERELHTNFYKLEEDQIRQIAHAYGITYYLGSPQQRLPFRHSYSDSYFTLYKISEANEEKQP
jgi:hypothetical protein